MTRDQLNQWLPGQLPLDGPIEVVDIGASPLGGKPPYRTLMESGYARVTGFEPNPEQFSRLEKAQTNNVRFLPYAVGDGLDKSLYLTRHRGFTSTLKPDASINASIQGFAPATRVIDEIKVKTVRLDDLAIIERIDLLKIDIQGGELAVFQHGLNKLSGILFVHTETAFIPLYHDQPLYADQQPVLASLGLMMYGFYSINKYPITTGDMTYPETFRKSGLGQVVDGDAVFMRDYRTLKDLEDQDLGRLAMIAHFVYAATNIVEMCLKILSERGSLDASTPSKYVSAALRNL